jgi:hypothetical protein
MIMRHFAICAFVIVATEVFNCCASAATDADSINGLRTSRVNTAQEWWTDLNANLGAPTGYSEYFRAAAALRDAQLDAAKHRSERLRALQQYCDRIEMLCKRISTLHSINSAGGESYRLDEANFLLLGAKLRLMEEKTKP